MRKNILSITVLLMSLNWVNAQANQSQILNCTNPQSKLQIRILPVNGDPSSVVFNVKGDLKVIATDPEGNNNVGKIAHIQGDLVGTFNQYGSMVSGSIKNQEGVERLINPESINLQLETNNDGTKTIAIYDQERIFQRGYGLWLRCK